MADVLLHELSVTFQLGHRFAFHLGRFIPVPHGHDGLVELLLFEQIGLLKRKWQLQMVLTMVFYCFSMFVYCVFNVCLLFFQCLCIVFSMFFTCSECFSPRCTMFHHLPHDCPGFFFQQLSLLSNLVLTSKGRFCFKPPHCLQNNPSCPTPQLSLGLPDVSELSLRPDSECHGSLSWRRTNSLVESDPWLAVMSL